MEATDGRVGRVDEEIRGRYVPGQGGGESAEHVTPLALDWIERNAARDDWFLHVNFWDPHTPYRTPAEAGIPFAEDPLPDWLTAEVRQPAWEATGMRCAQELNGWGGEKDHERYPRVPESLDSMAAVRQFIDGYDVGIRYADEHVGRLLAALPGRTADHLIGAATVFHLHHGEAVSLGMRIHPDSPAHHHPGEIRIFQFDAFHLEPHQGQPFG